MPWFDDVVGQTKPAEHGDDVVVRVELPPSVLDGCCSRVGVVVVVPAFAERQDRDEPAVTTVITGFVRSVADQMGYRVDRPRDVPNVKPYERSRPKRKCWPSSVPLRM